MKYARKLANMHLGQREDWNSFRESEKGKMYERHTFKVVSAIVRFGSHIRLHQLASVPETHLEERLLKEVYEKMRVEQGKTLKLSSEKLERLECAARVLRTTQALKTKNKREPTMYQVLGALALLHGLNSYELKTAVKHMHSTYANHSEDMTWIGTPTIVSRSINQTPIAHKNYAAAIDEILVAAKSPITSKQVLTQLGVSQNLGQMGIINSTFQLLETMNLAKKLPMIVDPKLFDPPCSVWISREYKPTLITYQFEMGGETHYSNVSMEILNMLHTGPKKQTELYRPSPWQNGNPNAVFGLTIVKKARDRLESLGLVNVESGIKGTRSLTSLLKLTPLGSRIWSEATETGLIPEELIELLLGEKENSTKELLRM
jgi:hypothetical protein